MPAVQGGAQGPCDARLRLSIGALTMSILLLNWSMGPELQKEEPELMQFDAGPSTSQPTVSNAEHGRWLSFLHAEALDASDMHVWAIACLLACPETAFTEPDC